MKLCRTIFNQIFSLILASSFDCHKINPPILFYVLEACVFVIVTASCKALDAYSEVPQLRTQTLNF